jgi:hypothetical protein
LYQGPNSFLFTSPSIPTPTGATFLQDIKETETVLNYIGALICPDQCRLGHDANDKLKRGEGLKTLHDNILLWQSFFSGIEVISNRKTIKHRDKLSDVADYDFLVSAGRHTEAWLELEDVKVKLHYAPGTVVAVYGKVLNHAVPDWEGGERLCVAHFTRDNVHERLGVARPDWVRNEGYIKCMDGAFLARQGWS